MSEDVTKEMNASFLEHMAELRVRLLSVFVILGLAFIVCLYFADTLFNLLLWPFKQASGGDMSDLELIYTAPQEFFVTQTKIALFGAVFLSFPFMAYQFYSFVAPGLYTPERRVLFFCILVSPILFLLGGLLVYFLIMPNAMAFFLAYEQDGEGVAQIRLVARVSEYLWLTMALMLAFGLCFQIPIVLSFMGWLGIIDADMLRRSRRYAVLSIFVSAAILTPPDPVSQIALAVPALLLYELSIVLVAWLDRKRWCPSAHES